MTTDYALPSFRRQITFKYYKYRQK